MFQHILQSTVKLLVLQIIWGVPKSGVPICRVSNRRIMVSTFGSILWPSISYLWELAISYHVLHLLSSLSGRHYQSCTAALTYDYHSVAKTKVLQGTVRDLEP